MERGGSSGRSRGHVLEMARGLAHREALRGGIPVACEQWRLSLVPGPGQSYPELRGRDRQMVWNVHRHRESEAEPADFRRADIGADDAISRSQHPLAGGNAGEGLRPQRTRSAERKNDGGTQGADATCDRARKNGGASTE